MKEEFGIEVGVGDFFAESTYHYENGEIRLLAYRTSWTDGRFTMKAHADCRWVTPSELNDFEFAPADIPLVEKLQQT